MIQRAHLQVLARKRISGGSGDLLTSLISYWKMDEASGTRVDAHSTNDLTDNNTVGSTTGIINNGALFVATNSESLSHADNAALSTGNIDFTLSFWFKTPVEPTRQMLITKDELGQREYVVDYTAAGGGVRFYINGGAVITPSAATELDTWYFVVAWHDAAGDTINIQVNDGSVESTGTGGAAPSDTTAAFGVGWRNFSGFEDYFDGIIDEVGFWKRVLTTQERTDLYNSGAGLSYDNF